jgi:hypothetical protein
MPLLLSFVSLFIRSEIKSTAKQEIQVKEDDDNSYENNNNNKNKNEVELKVNDANEPRLHGSCVVIDGYRFLLNKPADGKDKNSYYACAHKAKSYACFLSCSLIS